jgi:ribonucleoside-diphosphate reductase alpha chain
MSLPDAVSQVLEEHLGIEQNGSTYPQLPDEEDINLLAKQYDLGLSGDITSISTADICPICGNVTFINIEGCRKCFSCGHSEC